MMKIGVEGFTFDSAHYTGGSKSKCLNLHGHTFRLDVEVEGEVNPQTGMVIDFSLLKDVVKRVIADYDHRVIPRRKTVKILFFQAPSIAKLRSSSIQKPRRNI